MTSSSEYLGAEGRLGMGPSHRLAVEAFGTELMAASELHPFMYFADAAHVAALVRSSYVSAAEGQALMMGLRQLRDRAAADIDWRSELGDTYNNRDELLKQLIGAPAALLSIGRSRRESMTVASALAARSAMGEFVLSLQELVSVLAAKSDEHAETLLGDQTYLQHAHPTTLGHYLLTFSAPLVRSIARVRTLLDQMDHCPAGVGGVNGSRLELHRDLQAELLGWDTPMAHARDAMWAPDLAIAPAAEAVIGLTCIGRLVNELQIWATTEYGFVRLHASHCRTSVVMPQKRNPYALTHVRGTVQRSVGEMVGLTSTQQPFTGQPDSRTLAYETLPPMLRRAAGAFALLAEVVELLEVDAGAMAVSAADPFMGCTDICDYLTESYRVPNRDAHRVLGLVVRNLVERGELAPTPANWESEIADVAQSLDVELPQLNADEIAQAIDPLNLVTSRSDRGEAAPSSVRELAAEHAAIAADEPQPLERWRVALATFDERVDLHLKASN